MDTEVKVKLVLLVLVIVLGIFFCYKCDKDDWNDGYCPNCGTSWRYEQAVGHRFSTGYIYVCDKCGNHIEISYAPWTETTETDETEADAWMTEET